MSLMKRALTPFTVHHRRYNDAHKHTLNHSRSCDFNDLRNRKWPHDKCGPFKGLKTSHQVNSEGKSILINGATCRRLSGQENPTVSPYKKLFI